MPAGPSGRPTSVELTTSCASAPTAAPVWPPTIIPPILRIIWPRPPSAPNPPVRAVIAERISGGSSPASSSGSSVSIPPIASTARAAIGSHSFDQTGSVASTHSARLQAWVIRMPVGRVVASSSHRSAVRSASVVLRRSISRTLASPCAATVCRATFFARSQLTGPPCQDIRSANWRRASANCCGSPSGPSGPPAPPPGPPAPPRPAPPPASGLSGSRSGSPGRPKPKGGSVISAASRAGWKSPRPPRYPGSTPW